jgi:hypothetical protein
MPPAGPFSVWAESYGYQPDHFELGDDAPSQISVLRLSPAPLAIEGITVEAEAALAQLVEGLENRRNAVPYAVRAFDRGALDRLAQPGSVYDFLRIRVPTMRFCDRDPFQLCVPSRFRSFTRVAPQRQLMVCVDEWRSFVPSTELQTTSIDAVALVEIYPGEIRVYTRQWLLNRAGAGRTRLTPLIMGCTGL